MRVLIVPDLIKQLLAGKRVFKSLSQPPQIRANICLVVQFVAILDLIDQSGLLQIGENSLHKFGIAEVQTRSKLLTGSLDTRMLVKKE